jgi:transporter family-2 protein
MQGVIFSLIAGVLISLQSVFNTRLSEKLGLWQTNTIVHGLGFLVSMLLFLIIRDGNVSKWNEIDKVYLLGGVFGAFVVYTVMQGITKLGPAYAVTLLLVSQLIVALIIDTYGLFGTEKVAFTANKGIGIAIMIIGILVFKLK